eukprot:g5892.t1
MLWELKGTQSSWLRNSESGFQTAPPSNLTQHAQLLRSAGTGQKRCNLIAAGSGQGFFGNHRKVRCLQQGFFRGASERRRILFSAPYCASNFFWWFLPLTWADMLLLSRSTVDLAIMLASSYEPFLFLVLKLQRNLWY